MEEIEGQPSESRVAGSDWRTTRRYHTRSRSGCLQCRQRHIRCDEARPLCIHCSAGKRQCVYPNPALPLRDRRRQGKKLLPGQLEPWSAIESSARERGDIHPLWQTQIRIVPGNDLDPFDALPIKMPFKSWELFQYFNKAGSDDSLGPGNNLRHYVAITTHDEAAMRSTLILAGLHYAWDVGDQTISDYESAFLYHKVDAIRNVNKWLPEAEPKTAALCVRHIATLCFSEMIMGHLQGAATHLMGIVSFLEQIEAKAGETHRQDSPEVRLVTHYVILTHFWFYALRSRMVDTLSHEAHFAGDDSSLRSVMHKMHYYEPVGRQARLQALRLFPHFFSPPEGGMRQPCLVTARCAIRCLGAMNPIATGRYSGHPLMGDTDLCEAGYQTRILREMMEAHVASMEGPVKGEGDKDEDEWAMPWTSLAATVGFYLHSILGVSNAAQPMERRFMRQLLLILELDLMRTEGMMRARPGTTRDLWLWKVFVAALALAKWRRSEMRAGNNNRVAYAGDAVLQRLHFALDGFIRTWGAVSGVTSWIGAKTALMRVVWPEGAFEGHDLAEMIWGRAVWGL